MTKLFSNVNSMVVVTAALFTLAACGKFASDPAAGSKISPAANPLKAEQEDAIKRATKGEADGSLSSLNRGVPDEIAALFANELKKPLAGGPYRIPTSRNQKAIATVERLNGTILKRRAELVRLQAEIKKGVTVRGEERTWVTSLAAEYKSSAINMVELLNRVDEWPPEFVLVGVLISQGEARADVAISEAMLAERIAFLNTSPKPEIIAVRKLRAELAERQVTGPQMTSREKTTQLIDRMTRGFAPAAKVQMLKALSQIEVRPNEHEVF